MKIYKLALMMTLALSPILATDKGKMGAYEELLTDVNRVILETELTPQLSKEILSGKHPYLAIESRAGTDLPIKYFLNGGFFSVKFEPNLSIKIEKNCYIRILSNKKAFLSFDLKSWDKPNLKLLDTQIGLSADKSHIVIQTSENPDYKLD